MTTAAQVLDSEATTPAVGTCLDRGLGRQTLAKALRDEMKRTGAKRAWSGDPDLCLTAYECVGGRVVHPLNRIKAVLDAARRSDLFEQRGYIRACDITGRREALHPQFVLRPNRFGTAQPTDRG